MANGRIYRIQNIKLYDGRQAGLYKSNTNIKAWQPPKPPGEPTTATTTEAEGSRTLYLIPPNKSIKKDAHFGNEEYSKEELVAEIGAAAVMNYIGIETDSSIKNNAAYIQSWIKALKGDSKLIVSAAGKAEKAVNLILDREVI